jgi:type VI secretion system protein ImpF
MDSYRQDEDELPTVLDRLLYQRPKADDQYARDRDPLLTSIARDLEALLNTRRQEAAIPAEYAEVGTSILNFGVPEFDHYGSLATATEQTMLCKALEASIRLFEPRLNRVSVRLLPPGKQDNALRFRIEATIGTLGDMEIFEADLRRDSKTISVTSGGAA